MEKLRTGVAYHGNRILKHVHEDMVDIVKHNMNTVVHMFSHTDWDRHSGVMKDIVKISESVGLEVWIDNWGISGNPGDKAHFLQYHPESHQVYSNGQVHPYQACYNSPAFIQFSKDWVYAVKEFGGKKIFWDEPHLPTTDINGNNVFTCHCDTCKKLFLEKYGKPMPSEFTPEVEKFRIQTIYNYFETVTDYAASLGLENSTCIMTHTLRDTMDLINVKNITDFGIDPYFEKDNDEYGFVYEYSKLIVDETKKLGKNNHIWIRGWDIKDGDEDKIILSADAAYDAGSRTILSWSFRGAESNTYKCDKCEKVWQVTGEAMARIRARHFDALRAEKQKRFIK